MGAAEPSLFGRTDESTEVLALIEAHGSVVIEGPAGIGKTFLAHHCIELVEARRIVEHLLPSPATARLPLAALAPLGAPGHAEPGDFPTVASWYLRRWSRLCKPDAPPIVWIDDIQHLDAVSASIIRHALDGGSIQVIASHRTPEPLPDDIEALVTEGRIAEVRLGPMPESTCRVLADTEADRSLEPMQHRRIFELSAGFPLFVRDLARVLIDGDDPVEHVHDIVERRLGALKPAERRVARMVAISEPIDRRLFADDRSELDALVRRGIVRPVVGGRLRIDHPLYTVALANELGPAVSSAYRGLIDRHDAATAREPRAALVEPLMLATWFEQAERSLPASLLESALTQALARSDGASAARFAVHIDGARGRIARAQGLVLGGEIERGLDELEAVCDGPASDVTISAASWAARYIGLTLGQIERGHSILGRVDATDLDDHQRRVLMIGRLWLWMFSSSVDEATFPALFRLTGTQSPDDVTTHELAHCSAGLVYQVRGPLAAAPLLDRIVEIEGAIDIPLEERARSAAVLGWGATFAGDALRGLDLMVKQFERALTEDDRVGLGLLAGTAAVAATTCGRVGEATRLRARAGPLDEPDWFRFGHLADLIAVATTALAGTAEVDLSPVELPVDPRFDLETMLAARSVKLVNERDGKLDSGSALVAPFERLARNQKRSWLAIFSSELVDLHDDPHLWAWLADELMRSDPSGAAGATQIAMSARTHADAAALVGVAEDYERAGFVISATRCHADVIRMTSDEPLGLRARAGLMRCRLRWDGGPTWWLDDIAGLPSTRQFEIAETACRIGIGPTAETAFVSRRTVENHVYRTCSQLGLSGRDELTAALAPLDRPVGWTFGRNVE